MNTTEEQENEILALSSIYEENRLLFAQDGDDPGGVFMAPQKLSKPLQITVGGGGDTAVTCNERRGKELLTVCNLPPITLNFTFPWDYPSSQAPHFVLSCLWLSQQQLSKLCRHLDEIWEENRGDVILFHWFQFLEDEAFQFLQITSPLDLSFVTSHPRRRRLRQKSVSDSQATSGNPALFSSSSTSEEANEREFSRCFEPCENLVLTSTDISCVNYSPKELGNNVSIAQGDSRAIQQQLTTAQLLKCLLDFDKEKEQEEFDRSAVSCAVCFTERLGRQCMRFLDCGHAFCRDCLRDYFSVQIKDGNMTGMICPEPKCESQAYPHQIKELVTLEEYERYDKLLLQTTLETMADVVYCPRWQCQHPVIMEASDRMACCPNCHFAFCPLCRLSYHGLSPCRIKSKELQKLREEYLKGNQETKRLLEKRYGKRAIDQALEETFSAEWLEENAKACPYCGTQIQKTEGCNKMTCIKCRSYFCWLCNSLLSRSNPYSHFSATGSQCFEKLFEGVDVLDELEVELENEDEDFFNAVIF